MPSTKDSRQPTSPDVGRNSPPMIPLMPKMRPLNKMKTAEARPSKIPPDSEAHGVKLFQSIMTAAFLFYFKEELMTTSLSLVRILNVRRIRKMM